MNEAEKIVQSLKDKGLDESKILFVTSLTLCTAVELYNTCPKEETLKETYALTLAAQVFQLAACVNPELRQEVLLCVKEHKERRSQRNDFFRSLG